MRLDEPEPGPAPVRDARRQMYRRQILAAAEREFGRAGFADTKVGAIAAAAGLSLATVYKTFDGKNEIWDALHTERMAALLASVEAGATPEASALERLLGGVGSVARFLMAHPPYLEMSLQAGVAWAGGTGSGRGVQATVWSAGQDMLAAGAAAALDAGEIDGLRPLIAAAMVVSALQVWLSEWVASGRDRDPDVVVAELAERLRRMLAATKN